MISPFVYSTCVVFLFGVSFIVFRVHVRRDYRNLGQLGRFTGFLEGAVWALFICFPFLYNPPIWMFSWSREICILSKIIGLTAVISGFVLAFYAMGWLGVRRSFGQDTKDLKRTGLYRFTRNPQIVGGALMVLGECTLWPSWYAYGWGLSYAVIAHMMVITEEEHLKRIFGSEYDQYCRRVPRYLGYLKD